MSDEHTPTLIDRERFLAAYASHMTTPFEGEVPAFLERLCEQLCDQLGDPDEWYLPERAMALAA